MQFKPDMTAAIREGRKTQTRRPTSIHDSVGLWGAEVGWVKRKGRILWEVGRTYSVCPGRGEKRVGGIRILAIRSEVLLMLPEEDARREGFTGAETFLAAWHRLYPKANAANDMVWVLTFEKVGQWA
jgi:hypothetical protein